MPNLTIHAPPFPNRDEHPFVGTTRYRQMTIDLENLDGSTREGKDANGNPWKVKFQGAHYGEIRHSKGADGDPVDVYLKNPPDDGANVAYIIHQNHPRNHPKKPGEFDEDKVILGVSSPKEAKELYLRHYSRKDFFRSLTMMGIEKFKRTVYEKGAEEKIAMVKTAHEAYVLGFELGAEAALEKLGLATAGLRSSADDETPEITGELQTGMANAQAPKGMPTQPAGTPRIESAAPRPAPAI
jgi:hypothetical protein